MAFNKKTWKDRPDTSTPIDANGLNNLENRIGNEMGGITTQLAHIDEKKIDKNRGAVTSADLSQEVKEQMTGGSVAVVGKNSILRENIVDKQVTHDKTDFIEEGKNLFNKEKVKLSRSINSTHGKEIDSEYYDLYEFEILPNRQYTENFSFAVAEYDESGAFNRENFLPNVSSFITPRTFTTSATASLLKIVVLKGQLDNFQIELGTTSTEYERYKLTLKYASSGIEDYLISPNEKWEVI